MVGVGRFRYTRTLSVHTISVHNFSVQMTLVHWISVLVHVKFSTSHINFGACYYQYKITFGSAHTATLFSMTPYGH